MAALDFPASPSLGQRYSANGSTWEWNGSAWIKLATTSGPTDQVTTTNDTSTAALYPVMVDGAGDNKPLKVSTSKIKFDASAGGLTVTGTSGEVTAGVGNTALIVDGDARVLGILTVGSGTVKIDSAGVTATGVATFTNFKTGTTNVHNVGVEAAGINVLGADTPIGTGATVYNSGLIVSKSGGEYQGVVTASTFKGAVEGNINATTGTFSGDVSIGGVLTYEDVKNVDSVGIITARSGVNVTSGSVSVTDGYAYRFGDGSYRIEGKDDGVNARIGFLAGGSERLRITSNGHIVTQGLTSYSFNNDTSSAKVLEVTGDGTVGEYGVINISGNQDANNTQIGALKFINRQNSNGSSGGNAGSKQVAAIQAYIKSDGNGDDDSGGFLTFHTKGEADVNGERARIDSTGRVLIGGTAKSTNGDGRLIVYSSDKKHPAIKCAGTSSSSANGWTMLGDNYLADESQVNLGVSYSSSSFVISRCVKVSDTADNVYLSSQDSYNCRPTVFRLDSDGSFSFLNTSTNATVATDSAVTLTERLRITSGGNVGIGTDISGGGGAYGRLGIVIPSQSGGSALQVMNSAAGSSDGDLTNIVLRSVNNSGTQWAGAEFRAYDYSFKNQGTAALSITSSGDVSISSNGNVHGISKLTVLPAGRTTAFSASDGDTWHDVVLKQTGSATNNAVGIAFETSTSGYHKNAGTGIAAVKNGTNSDYGSDLVFITRPQSAVAAERLRIKSDGSMLHTRSDNVQRHDVEFRQTGGIGSGNFGGIKWTQGSTGGTFLSGITIAYHDTGRPAMVFYQRDGGGTGSRQTVNIDRDGTMIIGEATDAALAVNQSTGRGVNLTASGRVYCKTADHWDLNRVGTGEIIRFRKGADSGTQTHVGNITVNSSSVTYSQNASDSRLKKNIETWTDEVLPHFKTLQPKKFNYNWETDTDTKSKGYMAQDVTSVFPEAYPMSKVDVDGSEEDRYMFAPGGMVIYLMKALQEEIAKREALEARIAALESS